MSINVLDFFAGCGGFTTGLAQSGVRVAAAFDSWGLAVDTYRANHGHPAYVVDLADVQAARAAIAPHMHDSVGFVGGPPCQDYSSSGNRIEGARASLTLAYADLITYFRPRFFVMENVPRAPRTRTYQDAISRFRRAGYAVHVAMIEASDTGAPQWRQRAVAVGVLDAAPDELVGAFDLVPPSRRLTVRDAIPGIDVDHYYRHPRHYVRRAIFSVDEPSVTISGANRPMPASYKPHPGDTAPPREARTFTPRERALLQTFPESYEFVGAKTHVEQMIGNAVPVKLASHIGRSITGLLGRVESSAHSDAA